MAFNSEIMNLRTKIFALITAAILLSGAMISCRMNSVSKYQTVVQQIEQGSLTANDAGVIQLPESLKNLAPRGEVYIERKPDNRLLILFPTGYGRGNDIEGYLYCSESLQPSDYYQIEWGAGGVGNHIDVAGWDMLTTENLQPNWYKVSRRLD